MSEFITYLSLGFHHIVDPRGYDHLLFLLALCAIYDLQSLRRVIILVTAFTVGHSITLALAVLEVVSTNADLIEFLIPVTIFITAFTNFFQKKNRGLSKFPNQKYRYIFASVFGLIHGLGFSNYLRSLLGKEAEIITPLLSFNLGIEIGQILIVAVFLTMAFLLRHFLQVKRREINLIVSGAAAGISLVLIFEKFPW